MGVDLSSPDTTNFIDTGFAPSVSTEVEIDYEITSTTGSSSSFWPAFGSRGSSYQFWVYYRFAEGAWSFRRTKENIEHFIERSMNARSSIVVDGNTMTIGSDFVTATAEAFTTDNSMFVFAVNNAMMPQYFAYAKCYSCRIWDDGVLVRDFLPCERTSDGKQGFWDQVYGVFYPLLIPNRIYYQYMGSFGGSGYRVQSSEPLASDVTITGYRSDNSSTKFTLTCKKGNSGFGTLDYVPKVTSIEPRSDGIYYYYWY